MPETEFNKDEFLFRVRDVECNIKEIDLQIERLQIERDKFIYELSHLDSIYTEYMQPEENIVEETIEKPKRLKKSNDKPSQNNTKVQLEEGRS